MINYIAIENNDYEGLNFCNLTLLRKYVVKMKNNKIECYYYYYFGNLSIVQSLFMAMYSVISVRN